MNPQTLPALLSLREKYGTIENLGKAVLKPEGADPAEILLALAVIAELWNNLPEIAALYGAQRASTTPKTNLTALVAALQNARDGADTTAILDLVPAILDALSALAQQPEEGEGWVLLEDGLPETYKRVVISAEGRPDSITKGLSDVFVAKLVVRDDDDDPAAQAETLWEDQETKREFPLEGNQYYRVIAWKNMPKPYLNVPADSHSHPQSQQVPGETQTIAHLNRRLVTLVTERDASRAEVARLVGALDREASESALTSSQDNEAWLHLRRALDDYFNTQATEPDHEESYQDRVHVWASTCFDKAHVESVPVRCLRFLEEAVELVQSLGCSKDDALRIVDYVYGREIGDPVQEAGGVMVTVACLCQAAGINLDESAELELARVWMKVEQIRAKQAHKMAPEPTTPKEVTSSDTTAT